MNEIEKPTFVEKSIECVDCGVTFDFTIGEQEYFWSKGLADPKRCSECRKLRKATLVRDYSGRRWLK
ncbi:MAG: zinc-ribbon domain-containing protein [Proteobacteria bacterium]|nr:zinc-ribbon domain-containing protein [Pseudomonadota bacterium]